MPLTSSGKDPEAFPYWQLTVLAICRFSEPIAFNSILAYSYVMTIELNGGDDTDASFYSGLLVSAYAVAEALTAVGWGTLSDYYGRKPVVLFGLSGVALSCLIFGFAQNFWVALVARFIGGALNGNVSVMQTMVAEMVKVPEHEPAAYAMQPFVWTLGGIVGSALGGFLAQPAHFYPDLFPEDGIFGKYPFLLPNLTSVVVIVLAIIQGMIFLEETNPRHKAGDVGDSSNGIDNDEGHERSPLLRAERVRTSSRARSSMDHRSSVDGQRPFFAEEGLPAPGGPGQTFDIRRTSFGTMHSIEQRPKDLRVDEVPTGQPEPPQTYEGPIWTRTVIMLIIALILISYHQMAANTLLPIHLLDEPLQPPGRLDFIGGFGLTLHDVSTYLVVNGILSLAIQAFIFPIFVAKAGVWKSLVSIIILYPTAYLLMPFLAAAPKLIPVGVYASLILQAFYGIISVPVALIYLKDATPSPLVLGRVNGLAMSACCAARTVAPPLVGVLYGAFGSAAAWFSCAGVAVLGALELFWVPRHHVKVSIERPSIHARNGNRHENAIHEDAIEA